MNNYLIYSCYDAINKNLINVYLFPENKDKALNTNNKEIALIIPIFRQPIIFYYDETINQLLEKGDNKKKQLTKSDKETFIERQTVDDNKKK